MCHPRSENSQLLKIAYLQPVSFYPNLCPDCVPARSFGWRSKDLRTFTGND